ncbi:GPO family capsid scaffolding protein [Microbulbifer taiwanensis]|uniref:GPO family capsid scaffolding protein n=1 Tax=Microbulbifer taiwanensis TaxID=986746 RepID=A0ABW1YLD1_9GAMM|nr:GPO family capsid scaffolding protein [Microbulbifer taiwanensis]
MARKLYTDWVKVATSGPTIDGRNISAQDISDMAESYAPDEYTANIWYEHIRVFGNLGKVVELKSEKDSKGRMCLFAKLAPTDDLIYMNNRGQKLFTSIEIQPEFADTGKAYLAGLAVTDSPASLGTTELQFSSRLQQPGNFFAEPVELGDLELEQGAGLLGRLLEQFGKIADSHEPKPKGETPMDNKQFNSLKEILEGLQSKIGEMENKFASNGNGGDGAEGGDGGADESAPVSKKEFQALMDKVDALGQRFSEGGDGSDGEGDDDNQVALANLSKQLEELTEKFNKALDTGKPGTKVPEGEGDGGTARVL